MTALILEDEVKKCLLHLLLGQKEFSAEGMKMKNTPSAPLDCEWGDGLKAGGKERKFGIRNLVYGEKMASERERNYIIP